ncbi:sensor histidine kinase [Phytohalomonas tamaricis]|uniref:sensor histidine kinase n=1 Tax=Phytohalomonas tamaricis TaxID=2081032 RepID=UPI000D0AF814|nr:sensor histidine kinase [Phytohalomonas tamaricis]
MIVIEQSLRRRLLLWLAAVTLVFGVALLIEAYVSARRAADRTFDGLLDSASLTIGEAIQWQDGKPLVAMPSAALQILATPSQERVFYALFGANGETVTANAALPISDAMRRAAHAGPVYADITHDSVRLRIEGREIDSAGWETREPVQIWVAHTRGGREALIRALMERAALRFIVMALLAAALVWLAVRTSLAPLERIRQLLRARTPDDLRPLAVSVPLELKELVIALDQLLERQRASHDRLMRFIADASHQLKTPLAGLQSTSELALRSTDAADWHQALVEVNHGARRSARLAQQLLSLARLDHRHDEAFVVLDLVTLARARLIDWIGRAASQAHDLGFDGPNQPVMVRAIAWQLEEFLNNALDNALRYTPPDSAITVGVVTTAQQVTLFVEDDGAGVDEALLPRLAMPFERAGRQDTTGSGLGLAIAASVATHHNAELAITRAGVGGLRVALHFKRERLL